MRVLKPFKSVGVNNSSLDTRLCLACSNFTATWQNASDFDRGEGGGGGLDLGIFPRIHSFILTHAFQI